MNARRAFWLVTLAALAGALATGALGAWQLRRAAAKEALAAAISKQNSLQVLDNTALLAMKNVADAVHRQARLEGNWMPGLTVFLDNRQMHGVPGFFVVTPLRLAAGGPLLMVQRGWVQRDFSNRSRLPAVPAPAGLVTVSGRVAAVPGRLYEPARLSGGPAPADGSIRQNLDLAEVSRLAGAPVLELSLLQTGDAPDGLQRDWPEPSLGIEKHLGYAAQWFGLCALIVGLYLWFQLIAPMSAPVPPAKMPEAAPDAPDQLLGLTVHSLPAPGEPQPAQRTVSGRLKMLLVLAVCAAPVLASYFTYYVLRPEGRRNYGELIDPQRPLPLIAAQDLGGQVRNLQSLKGQWLLVAVGGAACDAICQNNLYLQRQLRESLGKEKDRLDRVWLVTDAAPLNPSLAPALQGATVWRVPVGELANWLAPQAGRQLGEHLYLVDPMGHWMLRFPAGMDLSGAAKAKRDLERLLRASSSWDQPGRP